MKRIFLFVFIITALFGCNADEKKATVSQAPARDSSVQPVITAVPGYDSITLKNITLTEKTVFGNKRFAALKSLNKQQIKELNIASFDEARSNDYRYYIMDTLYAGNKSTALLIARLYTEENNVWLALYDSTHQLTASKQVYYDNAEGFLSIETKILNNKITITTYNDFAETEAAKLRKEVFYVNRNGKLEKK